MSILWPPLTPPVPPPLPAAPPTADDLEFVRRHTNGAEGWEDAQLTALISDWTTVDCEQTPPVGVYDLWAAAAMVFEFKLVAEVDEPGAGGAAQTRSGDAHITYLETGASTWLLRSFITRYWRLADPRNKAKMHPSGWTTINVRPARKLRLAYRFPGRLAINGPGAGIEREDRD